MTGGIYQCHMADELAIGLLVGYVIPDALLFNPARALFPSFFANPKLYFLLPQCVRAVGQLNLQACRDCVPSSARTSRILLLQERKEADNLTDTYSKNKIIVHQSKSLYVLNGWITFLQLNSDWMTSTDRSIASFARCHEDYLTGTNHVWNTRCRPDISSVDLFACCRSIKLAKRLAQIQ